MGQDRLSGIGGKVVKRLKIDREEKGLIEVSFSAGALSSGEKKEIVDVFGVDVRGGEWAFTYEFWIEYWKVLRELSLIMKIAKKASGVKVDLRELNHGNFIIEDFFKVVRDGQKEGSS